MSVSKRSIISTFAFLTIFIFSAQFASAQLQLPRASQKASVSQTIGVTDLSITYFRPGVKGRKIYGEWPVEVKGEGTLDNQNARPPGAPIVPYGHMWRTGANEATQFVITNDATINGQKLPAGSYSLHTIPGKDDWTIIFNGTANQWGSFSYDAAKDTLRVKAKPQTVAVNQEWLEFDIEPTAENAAQVTIGWEKVRVPFTVAVDVPATALAHAQEAVAAAKADDWRTPFNAAGYANRNGDKANAAKWLDQALKVLDTSIAAKPTFQNLAGKADVLLAAGRKDEAFAVADKAIAQGKADKANTAAFEKRIADLRAGN